MYDWVFLCDVFKTDGNRLEAFKQWDFLYKKCDRKVPTNAQEARSRLLLSPSVPTSTVVGFIQQALELYPEWFVIPEIPTGAVMSLPTETGNDFVLPKGFVVVP